MGARKILMVSSLLFALGGCSDSNSKRPAAPLPLDPNDHVIVKVNCVSTAAYWVVGTQDTAVTIFGPGDCVYPAGSHASIRFDPKQPLTLILECVALVGDSLRCMEIARSYPVEDSVLHPPAVAYDAYRDIPDMVLVKGPAYTCDPYAIPPCSWGSIEVRVYYQDQWRGHWPDESVSSWSFPTYWPMCRGGERAGQGLGTIR